MLKWRRPRLPRLGAARVGCLGRTRATKVGHGAALVHVRACCGRLDALGLLAMCRPMQASRRLGPSSRWPLCHDIRAAARQAGARAQCGHAASRKQ